MVKPHIGWVYDVALREHPDIGTQLVSLLRVARLARHTTVCPYARVRFGLAPSRECVLWFNMVNRTVLEVNLNVAVAAAEEIAAEKDTPYHVVVS